MEQERPDILVVDSIQTIYHPEISSDTWLSITSSRKYTKFNEYCKTNEYRNFYSRSRNKRRANCGPRLLEHMVDTVLYFEGDEHHAYRILRAVKIVLVQQMKWVFLK